MDFAEDFDSAIFGFAGAGFGSTENLTVKIENAHFLDDVDATLDDVAIKIDVFGNFEVNVTATAGDALFDNHFAGDELSFPGKPSFRHKITAKLVKLTPFIFDVKIFDGMNMIDRVTVGVVMEKPGGDFFKATIKGGVLGVIEGVAEVNFVELRESIREFVVVVINSVDVRLPERKSEVGVSRK